MCLNWICMLELWTRYKNRKKWSAVVFTFLNYEESGDDPTFMTHLWWLDNGSSSYAVHSFRFYTISNNTTNNSRAGRQMKI